MYIGDNFVTKIITLLGLYLLVKVFLSIYKFIYATFLIGKPNLREYGAVELSESPAARSWAVVTGASDGIGYQFALQLALKGFNIFAISRTDEKLKVLADEIMDATNNKVVCETYVYDLCTKDDSKWTQLIEKINSLPTEVGVVVNNAGVNQSYPEFFSMTSDKVIQNIVDLNVLAAVKLTRGVLPTLCQTADGGNHKKIILNVASFAGIFPIPLLCTYSGSKAFMITWAEGLSKELSGTNVHVETVVPYYVTTKMSKIKKTSIFVPSPEKFVQCAISKLGTLTTHSPYNPHSFLYWLSGVLPKEFFIHMATVTNMKIRKLAIKSSKSN